VRRQVVKRRVGPALYQVMEPGDQIVGGTLAMTGSMTWDLIAFVPAITAGVLGTALSMMGGEPVRLGRQDRRREGEAP
jgi:hypothetical protein